MTALSVRDPTDPAPYWNRGVVFRRLERHYEATSDFLLAALFFQRVESTEALTGDEKDWSRTALFHACEASIRGGLASTGSKLLKRLRGKDRERLQQLLDQGLDDATLVSDSFEGTPDNDERSRYFSTDLE